MKGVCLRCMIRLHNPPTMGIGPFQILTKASIEECPHGVHRLLVEGEVCACFLHQVPAPSWGQLANIGAEEIKGPLQFGEKRSEESQR